MSARIGCLLLAFLGLAAVLSADQFGDVVFERPGEWSSVRQGDSLLLIPADVPKGFVLTLAIRKGENLNERTLRQYLDDVVNAEVTSGATLVSSAPVQEAKLFSGIPLLTTTRVMATREGANYLAQYFVMKAGSRGELVTVISNSETVVKKYSEVIGKFVASLQFVSPQQ